MAPDFLRLLGSDDPYPVLHRMREEEPVHLTSAGFYVLTRHADVTWALENCGTALLAPDQARYADEPSRSRRMWLGSLSMQNPPKHTRLRALTGDALSDAERLRRQIEKITSELLDTVGERLRDGEIVDVHSEVSIPLCGGVVAALLGVPPQERTRVAQLVTGLYPAVMPLRPGDNADLIAAADRCSEELERLVLDLLDQRRAEPQDDLLSAVVSRYDAERGELNAQDLVALVWVMWIAGVETSAGVLDQCVRAMTLHPGLLHEDNVDGFVAETLRLYASSLFAGVVRIAAHDIKFSGGTVPAGADVRPSIAAAHRDPSVFTDPDEFRPSRDHGATLSFGGGIHLCPAADVSQLVTSVALTMIHSRFPGLVAAGEPVWHGGVATRLLRELPVALKGGSR